MAQNTVNMTTKQRPVQQNRNTPKPVGQIQNKQQVQQKPVQAGVKTQGAKVVPQQVSVTSPQYDVKVVTKGVESFMVSFNFATTPITQIADYIIASASKHNASDIHFDPREDGMMVRFRIDGDLQDYTFIPLAYERNLTTRLKLLANMNITESAPVVNRPFYK